ncbi:hypothetical protein [Corallococcus macrosporus]|uniref:Coagulation factor 5/8 type-like protein n=2 Tax=Myxococcaceae TaxID=31 RepID=A0A250JX99_9BACT|nr:hypothetical protein [Corallococcus macrosporus]AEI66871.1 coagulation factor 5/8 type-like protein [Corallococcus macrosporus]ATB47756.1 coagulation factor 5/8 type-like protein [Corallococcus macrosporus DSM 14697]
MSLLHDFLLREEGTHRYEDHRAWMNAPQALHLHDDVVQYLNDTLLWIPALNPATRKCPMEPVQGLCHYGPTIINRSGGRIAAQIFQHWADLFACGPEQMVLTGGWCTEPDGRQHYNKLEVQRDPLVSTLRTLATWARQAEAGSHFIYHWGI